MINVSLYYSEKSSEHLEIVKNLEGLQEKYPHKLVLINVDENHQTWEKIGPIPMIEIGPYRLNPPFTIQDLQAVLGAATDRHGQLEKTDQSFQKRVDRGNKLTGTDRFSLWFCNHYMALFNLLVFLYVGLPFLAPTFMKVNLPLPAKVIYTIYSPLCHQFPFRSWFLFGPQPYYPTEMAHIPGMITYEEISGQTNIDAIAARDFIGNPSTGYKVAFCERDIAIYGSIFLFGLIFSLTGRKLKSIPWYLWVVIGLIPIGIDGVSQLPSLLANILPGWVPQRESTPFLRTLTGGMFGFTTAWYLYPLIEESLLDTRRLLSKKVALIGVGHAQNKVIG